MQLVLENISVRYPGQARDAVQHIGLALAAGETGVLLGPSGCGKTTLLRAIAGLEPVSTGSIRLAGTVLSGAGHAVPPEQRRMGMVFQDYALFPHMDVARNVAFGLQGWKSARRKARVADMLELVGLAGLQARYPHELSGGQQQRVALARALAPEPRLLLLDEPFSSLDSSLRSHLSHELRSILRRSGTTALLVTHDQEEAFAMADKIGVMHAGQLQQWADALTLYHAPATTFVARFVGHGMLLPARLEHPTLPGGPPAHRQVHTPAGSFDAPGTGPLPEAATRVSVLLRRHEICHDAHSGTSAVLQHKVFCGSHWRYTLRLDSGETLQAEMPAHLTHQAGERIGIRPQPRALVAFAG